MKRRSLNIFTISIGNKYQIKHKFTAYDVTQFANISTDQNPHHIDQLYAQNSIFG